MLADNNLRAQLEKVERETGRRPAQLDAGGDLPDALSHVWFWFLDLSAARAEYRPLCYAELDAYFRMNEINPLPIEVEAIRTLDSEWVLHKANTLKSKG